MQLKTGVIEAERELVKAETSAFRVSVCSRSAKYRWGSGALRCPLIVHMKDRAGH